MEYRFMALIQASKNKKDVYALIDYLDKLTPYTTDIITPGKVSNRRGISYKEAEELLDECVKHDILVKRYALACPNCELLLKQASKERLEEVISKTTYCYRCEYEDIDPIELTIIPIYELLN